MARVSGSWLCAGVIVVCAEGGGIPVIVTPDGGLQGIEAVIDKDAAAALLAEARTALPRGPWV